MRHHIAVWVGAAVALTVVACSKPAPPAPEASPPPAPTVFDPLTSNIDRAQQVQGVVDEQAEASRRAVAAQEQGDAGN